ncbi:hypothetical protein HanXRQr2_Chr06g0251281 [Helianthus annuus]|uniref:Uncharacterized protein n=1 Tax=Helianthus annuus TaxID=4232 RepID=A0A9K3NIH2_HELAN|nr:hypothetical protein HanXRQr2_Chr06g0251281 [Helianthus annuus]KAJ0559970.1 hypothetical protein HanHA300_Chr06g0206351 [Helianthus annuus]KAJ0572959.1 hypothetical protein HanHA89_Chr06g0221501 [Helianthus annuus]KAJ0737401.1 hypothetical protein HanLR1_Chr06g0206601 [Helianthus annuus]
MILVLGIARRLPLVPPPRIMEAVDADMPSAIVDTSALTSFRTSYIAIEELFEPPVELIKSRISFVGS